MIQNISFGSTYKISADHYGSEQQKHGYTKLIEFCDKNQLPYEEKIIYPHYGSNQHTSYASEATIVAPDFFDKKIDTFLLTQGIDFSRYITSNLMQPKVINHRVKPAPRQMLTAYVNSQKLEEIIQNQGNNYERCKSDYKKFYQDKLDFMLKSGDEIPATTLHITSWNGNREALKHIKKYGSELLNKQSISFMFDQKDKINKPDYCMYFAMKDAGMTSIPVYVDYSSYELGLALGLFEDSVY